MTETRADGPFSEEVTVAASQDPTDVSSTVIGPYRLLQRVGEGGMGEVWVAEQVTPLGRQVALKVIKPGMDTAQVVARFEAERQALVGGLRPSSTSCRMGDASL